MTSTSDPVALTQALVACESVTPTEGGALTFLESQLTALGFTCRRLPFSAPGTPDVDNLYARLGTTAPHLCFAGHTDVVPAGDLARWTVPPFAGEIRDGVLYGRGTVDMKGGIACFLAATARYLQAHKGKLPGSLSFLITGDEEGPSINGTTKMVDWLKANGEKLDACVVGEPSNPNAIGDEIKIGRRGSLNCDIIVHGKQGHSAYPAKANNPIPALVQILNRLCSLEIDKGTPHFEASNLQVTILSVPNTATNIIPGEARATLNIRYNDLWRRSSIEDWVRLQCEKAAEGSNTKYAITYAGTGDVFLTAPGPLVETMKAAILDATGKAPALTTGGGTSDARFIKDICPVIEFGLVNKTIHAVDEHVPITDLASLTNVYLGFLERYFTT